MSRNSLFRFAGLLVVVILLATTVMSTGVRAAGPWYVATTGSDANDCLSPATPCATINGAIGKASSGDTVYVAEGTYTGIGNEVVFITKDLRLSGGWNLTFTSQSGLSKVDAQGINNYGISITDFGFQDVVVNVEGFEVENAFQGIHNGTRGILTVSNSVFNNNGVGVNGTGIFTWGPSLILNDSSVTGNGSGIRVESGTAVINNSTISGNSTGVGAGIFVGSQASLTINNSGITNNNSTDAGGGIYNVGTVTLNNSTVVNNSAGFTGGGGIYNEGNLTAKNSSIQDNSGPFGGGIRSRFSGVLTISNTTIGGNSASVYGGGLFVEDGNTVLTSVTLSYNRASQGGGAYQFFGSIHINNSTISNNIADFTGGGLLILSSSSTQINNSTLSSNVANTGGGIASRNNTLDMKNSIVAGNSAPTGTDCMSDVDFPGIINSLGYNIIGNTSDCGFVSSIGDVTNTDPLLGPLQDNDGPTFTHALLPGSPAINAGNPAGCTDQNNNPLTTDQRGVTRPQGTRCDIGAFELEVTNPVLEVAIDIKPGDSRNRIEIEPGDDEKVSVAILFTDQFSAPHDVDRTSLTFGATGNESSLYLKGRKLLPDCQVKDVNKDGLSDLVCKFTISKTGFQPGDTRGILKGLTVEGAPFEGSDSVVIKMDD